MTTRLSAFPVWILVVSLVVSALHAEPPTALEKILDQNPRTDELYRLVRLSDRVVFAKLASSEARISLLGEVGPAPGVGLWAGPTLSMTNTALAAELDTTTLTESGQQLREDLIDLGFIPAEDKLQVLITLVDGARVDQMFDFSDWERLGERQREEDLITQGHSGDQVLERRLGTRFGEAVARQAAYDADWKFDDQADVMAGERAREAERQQLIAGRRARFVTEAIRALYWVDPTYETTIIDWLESLPQEDTNRLARLLQLAGFDQMSPEILVRESAPNLHQPLVLSARLYQRLESVTVGGASKRQLDPERFANAEVLAQAESFYQQFFVADRKGRFEFELAEGVATFVETQSALVRELTASHLEGLLGSGWLED